MIHYHGLPITPDTAAVEAVGGGHAFVSFSHSDQIRIAVEVCQSFAVDNGAFSAWRSGAPVTDWTPYYLWAADCKRIPACDFAVIPDVIDGSEADNDRLVRAWPLGNFFGAPVWHMHESTARLGWLAREFHRVCIGSSGEFATVGTHEWWTRINQAMSVICDDQGRPRCKLHGLRMLNPDIFTRLPFASADSTNIGRNIGIDQRWTGSYPPASKQARARVIRERIEVFQSPARWDNSAPQIKVPTQGVLL